MGLVKLEEIASLLVCPRCRSEIEASRSGFLCRRSECPYSGDKHFRIVAKWPVLVDFERSILDEGYVVASAGASAIRRGKSTGWKAVLLSFMAHSTHTSARNIGQMIKLLKSNCAAPRVVVVGGGSPGRGTESLYESPGLDIIAFDVYGSDLTQFIADGHRIPLRDGSVDGVLVQAVLEHVLDPWRVVQEIHRILRPDGVVYSETPFLQQVHEGPFDFMRFTESGHRYLFRNFELIDSGINGGPGIQLVWTVRHVAQSISGSARVGKWVWALTFWLKFLDCLCRPDFAVDSATGVYFLGRRAESEIDPKAIIAHYKGAQRSGLYRGLH